MDCTRSTAAAAPSILPASSPFDSETDGATTFHCVTCQSCASSSSCRAGGSSSSINSAGPLRRSPPAANAARHFARDNAEEHHDMRYDEAEGTTEEEFTGRSNGSSVVVTGGSGGRLHQVWQAFMLLLILSLLTTMAMAYGAPGLQAWARDLQASEVRVIVRFDLPADREDLQQQLQQVGRKILQKFSLVHQRPSS